MHFKFDRNSFDNRPAFEPKHPNTEIIDKKPDLKYHASYLYIIPHDW